MIKELTEQNFSAEVLRSEVPVLVDFWASWCGPCKMLAPVFEELSFKYAGKLKFAKISVEDFPNLAQQQQVAGIPCLILFHQRKEVDRIIGFLQKDALKKKIDELLGEIR